MIMTDNNGISWPLVSVYANIGIKYLGFFPNTWNAPTVGGSRIRTENDSPYPHLFYWEGPDKTSRILVWAYNGYVGGGKDFGFRTLTARKPFIVEPEVIAPQMAVQLAKLEERYLYDIWLLADYDDNDYETPNLVFFNMVKAWNKKWKWPQLRAVGNLSEPFEIVEERFKNEIPTLSGTITGGWAQHPLTASDLLAQKRNIHRLLPTAEKLATIAKTMDNRYIYPTLEFKKAWNGLISYDEHSYGTSAYTGRTVYDTWSQKIDWLNDGLNIVETEGERALKSIANQISTDGTSIIVFNPSLQTRSEIIHFKLPEGMKNIRSVRYPDGSLSEIVRKGNSLSFLARNIPSLGYVVFRFVSGNLPPTENTIMEIPPIIENNFYKIKFDNTGSIVSVFDKELFHELVDQRAKYGFNQFVYTQDAHKSFSVPTVKHFEIEASSLGQTVVSYLEDTVSGASIKQSIFLPDFEKRIDIENRLNHVKDLVNIDRTNRYLRFGYYAFPIDIPRGKFKVELNGCVADAYKDQTGHGTNVYHAVNDWLHVSNNDVGITFVQNESHLIEFGKIHQNKTELEDYPMCSHIYSYIFTDWLYGNASTIGPSHLNFRFRYSITSHKGNVGDSYNARFAEKRVSPLQTAIIPDKQRGKSDKLFHSFASVTSDNIELLTLKMSEEPGRGIIVRFHETGGVKTKTTYRFDWLQDMQIIETSLSEQDLRELTNTNIELNPYGYTTIRLEAKGTGKLLSPNVSVKNITEKSIKLSWEKVDGAVQYNIYRATYDGFYHTSYHLLKTITDTLFVDDWIKSDKPYYYRISAIDKYFKEGDISLQLKVVTLKEGNFPPAKVGSFYTGLVSNPRAWRSDTSDVLYLQWGQNQDSDLSHYELFRGDRPDFVADENSFVTKVIPGPYVVVPYEDKGLKSHTYYYRVRAIDHDGNKGELSDVFEGITRELDN
ncbi:MAG: glycosyl hydrolase-related protein [Tannerellaceae bacterium]|jgi:hypothetical protein|nr:glycosyl hydrolase-related protein [Tannerellaceae bacterium]